MIMGWIEVKKLENNIWFNECLNYIYLIMFLIFFCWIDNINKEKSEGNIFNN